MNEGRVCRRCQYVNEGFGYGMCKLCLFEEQNFNTKPHPRFKPADGIRKEDDDEVPFDQ